MVGTDISYFGETDLVKAKVDFIGPNMPNSFVEEIADGFAAVLPQHWKRIYKSIIHKDGKLELKA